MFRWVCLRRRRFEARTKTTEGCFTTMRQRRQLSRWIMLGWKSFKLMHFRGAKLQKRSPAIKPPSPIPNLQTFGENKNHRRVENTMTLKQACSSEYQGAQGAFKDSMIHWILQFTLLIAFRCVLHRCESQEIRCWKLYYMHSCMTSIHSETDRCML